MRKSSKGKKLLVILLGGWGAMQLVPFGRDHDNPPVRAEPAWDLPATRALAKRACFDCHSNETEWPWYSWIAPVSWVVTNDVLGGRHDLNFSEWDRGEQDADEAAEMVREGEMPLAIYVALHREAALSDEERQRLAASFERMFGTAGDEPSGETREGD